MTNIQIRIDEKEKKAAKRVFDKIGLDMSTAVKLFLRQATLRNGMPFLLLTENGLTLEEETEIMNASNEARKGVNVSESMDAKKALKHLKSL